MGRIVVGLDDSEPSPAVPARALGDARPPTAGGGVPRAERRSASPSGIGEATGSTVAPPSSEAEVDAHAAGALEPGVLGLGALVRGERWG